MPLRQIVVAYDASPPARRALSFAAELAEAFHASITVVHAIHVPVTPPEAALAGWAELLASEERAGEALAEEGVQSLRQRGLSAEARVVVGSPAVQVAEAATLPEVDLVVAGTTGKGTVARVFLGSVTTRLLHLCPKPILVVP